MVKKDSYDFREFHLEIKINKSLKSIFFVEVSQVVGQLVDEHDDYDDSWRTCIFLKLGRDEVE